MHRSALLASYAETLWHLDRTAYRDDDADHDAAQRRMLALMVAGLPDEFRHGLIDVGWSQERDDRSGHHLAGEV